MSDVTKAAGTRTYRSRMRSYSIGFILSVILTVIAFVLVMNPILPKPVLIADIIGLAVIQLFIQLFFFLHLGRESTPRWNLLIFLFAVLVVGIIVIGSLWIMNNLNYNMMMSPEDMNTYMRDHQGL